MTNPFTDAFLKAVTKSAISRTRTDGQSGQRAKTAATSSGAKAVLEEELPQMMAKASALMEDIANSTESLRKTAAQSQQHMSAVAEHMQASVTSAEAAQEMQHASAKMESVAESAKSLRQTVEQWLQTASARFEELTAAGAQERSKETESVVTAALSGILDVGGSAQYVAETAAQSLHNLMEATEGLKAFEAKASSAEDLVAMMRQAWAKIEDVTAAVEYLAKTVVQAQQRLSEAIHVKAFVPKAAESYSPPQATFLHEESQARAARELGAIQASATGPALEEMKAVVAQAVRGVANEIGNAIAQTVTKAMAENIQYGGPKPPAKPPAWLPAQPALSTGDRDAIRFFESLKKSRSFALTASFTAWSARPMDDGTIRLRWAFPQIHRAALGSFSIERRSPPGFGDWIEIAAPAVDVREYFDNTVKRGIEYEYRIHALANNTDFPPSASAIAVAPA